MNEEMTGRGLVQSAHPPGLVGFPTAQTKRGIAMTYEELREEFISKSFRKAIKDSLPDACCNCGSKKSIEYHHIVPLKLGGTNQIMDRLIGDEK